LGFQPVTVVGIIVHKWEINNYTRGEKQYTKQYKKLRTQNRKQNTQKKKTNLKGIN